MTKEYSALIKLAAEMVRGLHDPFDDENFYASTPRAERARIRKVMDQHANQCREWGVRLRQVADRLSDRESAI